MVKRFRIETNKLKERYSYLTDHGKSKMLFTSVKENPRIKYTLKINGKPMTGEVALGDFMDVKGWKAVGNRLSDQMLSNVKEIEPGESKILSRNEPPPPAATAPAQQASLFGEDPAPEEPETVQPPESGDKKTYKAGDTIEFD
jgi:topoisomerase-4 subunit A